MQRQFVLAQKHDQHTQCRDGCGNKEEKVSCIVGGDVPERHGQCQPGDKQAGKADAGSKRGERVAGLQHGESQLPRAHAGGGATFNPEADEISGDDSQEQQSLHPFRRCHAEHFNADGDRNADQQHGNAEQDSEVVSAGQNADNNACSHPLIACLLCHLFPQLRSSDLFTVSTQPRAANRYYFCVLIAASIVLMVQLATKRPHSASTTDAPEGHS